MHSRNLARVFAGAVGLCSCQSPTGLQLPAGDGLVTNVLLLKLADGSGLARVVRPDAPLLLSTEGQSEVYLFQFAVASESLGFDFEPFEVSAAPTNRPFPIPTQTHRLEGDAFVETSYPGGFFLPRIEGAECHRLRSCLDEGGNCVFPCEAPERTEVVAPQTPNPVSFGPCLGAFSSVTSDTPGGPAQYCVPPPQLDCPPNEAQFFGAADCRRVGTACGAWPEAVAGMTNVLFVDDDATPAGDGSEERPFNSLQLAISLTAGTATAVALAPGSYSLAGDVETDVAVYGACPSATIVELEGPIRIGMTQPASVTFSNLAFEASSGPVAQLRIGAEARVSFNDVIARTLGTNESPVIDLAGELRVTDSLFDDCRSRVVSAGSGQSLINIRNSVVRGGLREAVYSVAGVVRLQELVVRDRDAYTMPVDNPTNPLRGGVLVADGRLTLDGGLFLNNEVTDIYVPRTVATMRDVFAFGTRSLPGETRPDARRARAIGSRDTAVIELERAVLAETKMGVWIEGNTNSRFTGTDLVVRDIGNRNENGRSSGMRLAGQGSTTLDRVLIEDAAEIGLFLSGGLADVQELVVRESGLNEIASERSGLSRARIENYRGESAIRWRSGDGAGMSDVSVDGVSDRNGSAPDECAVIVRPRDANLLQNAEVQRIRISGVSRPALCLADGRITAQDIAIVGSEPAPTTIGVRLSGGGDMTVLRVVAENVGVGMRVEGGLLAVVQDVSVSMAQVPARSVFEVEPSGSGFEIFDLPGLSIESFRVEDCEGAGVVASRSVRLSGGWISNCARGLDIDGVEWDLVTEVQIVDTPDPAPN